MNRRVQYQSPKQGSWRSCYARGHILVGSDSVLERLPIIANILKLQGFAQKSRFLASSEKSEDLTTRGPHFCNRPWVFQFASAPSLMCNPPGSVGTWVIVTLYADSIVHCLPHEVSGPQVRNKRLTLYLDLKAVWKPLRSKDLGHGSKKALYKARNKRRNNHSFPPGVLLWC